MAIFSCTISSATVHFMFNGINLFAGCATRLPVEQHPNPDIITLTGNPLPGNLSKSSSVTAAGIIKYFGNLGKKKGEHYVN